MLLDLNKCTRVSQARAKTLLKRDELKDLSVSRSVLDPTGYPVDRTVVLRDKL
jgi:hypothetical protein